jgi:N-methylhydantoinase A
VGTLINIDNGGTLTDVVVLEGGGACSIKTLTTPSDLSQCFFDGLRKASRELYDGEDVGRLITEAEVIRYSTTQGTNALVQRRGPKLGLVMARAVDLAEPRAEVGELFDAVVADRVAVIASSADEEGLRAAALDAVSRLTLAGANRLVVSMDPVGERRLKRILLELFPPHLLGSVPIVYSHEVGGGEDDVRRTWTALLNAFLHPAMERFLYHADQRLRDQRAGAPLLIFRNDGGAARVAKTQAIKTYGSGPRGGVEGARALAAHYGLDTVITMDVGGTTTDVGIVEGQTIRERPLGAVEGVPIDFALADITSFGVGGGSVLRVEGNAIRVGPDSVGAAPGPACFGRGGTDATLTDALLLAGVLDAASYLGGEFSLDVERARAVIADRLATPLGIGVDEAVVRARDAWCEAVAAGVRRALTVPADGVLVAFGGAGPLLACRIAERIGVRSVLIPRAAAVFSAVGIGFCDIAQEYQSALGEVTAERILEVRSRLIERARRDMFAERIDIGDCGVAASVIVVDADGGARRIVVAADGRPEADATGADARLVVRVTKSIARPEIATVAPQSANGVRSESRSVLVDPQRRPDVAVVRLDALAAGASTEGPAVFEGHLFTVELPEGWSMQVMGSSDIRLGRV